MREPEPTLLVINPLKQIKQVKRSREVVIQVV